MRRGDRVFQKDSQMKTSALVLTLCAVVAISSSCLWAADKPLDFSGQDLPGRDFSKQSLVKANFEDAVLKKANFTEALATGANFQGADLTNAYFQQADLTGADFRGATLTIQTRFYLATLNEANLEKADLSLVRLSDVKLRKANLKKLKGIGTVENCDFSEADLRGANLVGMTIDNASRFRMAKYDSQTRWPKGFDVAASGAILVEDAEEDAEVKPQPAPG